MRPVGFDQRRERLRYEPRHPDAPGLGDAVATQSTATVFRPSTGYYSRLRTERPVTAGPDGLWTEVERRSRVVPSLARPLEGVSSEP